MNLKREVAAMHRIYQTARARPWPLEKPTVIQFPVNDICNAHCQMCNIWQQKLDYQISPEQIATIMRNPLFSEVRTVGINGGEPTLRKDLDQIVTALFTHLPRLQTVSLITNALKSAMTIQRIREMGEVIRAHGGKFDVMVSLDGYGAVHDRVRGRPGNFDNAVRVIDMIQSSDLITNRRLGCTVIKENIYGLHDLLDFAIQQDIYLKYRIGIPHQRLYSQDTTEPFALTLQERYHFAVFLENLIRFYEPSENQRLFYRSLIGQIMYGRPRTAGCDWQHRGATLTSRGELLYCAVQSQTLGSALNDDPERLYWGNEPHLHDIVKNHCDTCLHDYVGIHPRSMRQLPSIYADMWKKRLIHRMKRQFLLKSRIKPLKWPLKQFRDALKPLRTWRTMRRRMASVQLSTNIQPIAPAMHLPARAQQPYRVLIIGWYGTETLGDKAILGGIVQALGAAVGDIVLYVASLEPYISQVTRNQMPALHGSEIYPIKQALQQVTSMDLVIFGGGPIMTIPNVVEMLALFRRAADHGIPTILAGCGIGPIIPFSPYNQALIQLLQQASYRIYRDRQSRDLARVLGVDTHADQVAEDPSWTWLQHQCQAQPADTLKTADQPVLLLGLRDWPYRQYAADMSRAEAEQIKAHFEQEVVAALETLILRHPDLRILPFPMCTNHIGDDDRWFYRRLLRQHPTLQQAIVPGLLDGELSPAEAVQVFQSATAALTMRFHSLIFALSCGLPVVCIDYTLKRGKTSALAQRYQLPHDSLDSINRDFLITALEQQLARPHQLAPWQSRPLTFSTALQSVLQQLSA
ncbi:MAG: radical SAM protein [Chloroflexaceae bacterium]|nr:radical SAM protein [Chloroflexaceae bacterium]